jgi:hypothetical protein
MIDKPVTKIISNKNYHFTYIDIKYDNSVLSSNIELYRWQQLKLLKQHIKNIFIKYQLTPYKKNLDVNIDNLIARLLFENFSNNKITYLQDGLFNISRNSTSLNNDLKTTFTINKQPITNDICQKIISEIDINNKINNILSKIKLFKEKPVSDIKIIKKKSFTIEFADINPFNLVSITIPEIVYVKLKKRYAKYKKNNKKNTKITCDDLITCLLLRYNSLGSDGNQMGIPIQVKDKFKKCGIEFEGFASAVNHHYKYFCSMFYDIEKYFGSLGPFQNIEYIRGIFMVNPPYEKNLLNTMVHKINQSLDKSGEKLCFVFGTPTWSNYKEIKFHDVALKSNFYKKHYTFGDYEILWYNFFNDTYTKIPSSTRYILANYYINIKCLQNTIIYWRALKPVNNNKKS